MLTKSDLIYPNCCGAIANIIVNNISVEKDGIDVKYFFDKDSEKAENLAILSEGIAVLELEDMLDEVDLVLEAASPAALKGFALDVLSAGKDLMVMSVGALMDVEFRESLIKCASENDAKIYAPSGAIVVRWAAPVPEEDERMECWIWRVWIGKGCC